MIKRRKFIKNVTIGTIGLTAFGPCGWLEAAETDKQWRRWHEQGEDVKVPDRRYVSAQTLHSYVEKFNTLDKEDIINAIVNSEAFEFLRENVPLFECPDTQLEEIYYFRWWSYRKHIRMTPDGFVVTEFLPPAEWAKKHNTINCAVGHHLYEGRWLRDPKYLNDYIRFYFGKGGDPGGVSKQYSNWITDGILARYLVNADKDFVVPLLDDLVADHEAWNHDSAPGNEWKRSRLLHNELYWQIDSWEGSEYSIGGTGCRLPINSYMFGNAMAISRIAGLAGNRDLEMAYRRKAEELKAAVQYKLWDADDRFFKTLRHADVPALEQYNNRNRETCEPGRLVQVREIFGYVPWYFNMPDEGKGYEQAWRFLRDPKVFWGENGLTTADRQHPNFSFPEKFACNWNGSSWPFSTSQTLVALANLLNNYKQSVIGRQEYFDTLKAYARSHYFKRDDGNLVPWIDESLNPDTGKWIALGQYPSTRGRNYNHSAFCDLIITGLAGLRPRADNIVEVNPLVPENTWDWFCLDNIAYHGHTLTILWDRNGRHYGKGKGLRVLAGSREIAHSKTLSGITGKLPE